MCPSNYLTSLLWLKHPQLMIMKQNNFQINVHSSIKLNSDKKNVDEFLYGFKNKFLIKMQFPCLAHLCQGSINKIFYYKFKTQILEYHHSSKGEKNILSTNFITAKSSSWIQSKSKIWTKKGGIIIVQQNTKSSV